jgi:hypothetical protein
MAKMSFSSLIKEDISGFRDNVVLRGSVNVGVVEVMPTPSIDILGVSRIMTST